MLTQPLDVLISIVAGQTLILLGENNGPKATFVTSGKWDTECSALKNTLPGGRND
jgi:hypothetical protein